MFSKIKRLMLLMVNYFRRTKPTAALTTADIYAAGLVPPPEPRPEPTPEPEEQPKLSRKGRRAQDAELRRYERQRRKFDKFVTPQGPQPVKVIRPPKPAKLKSAAVEIEVDDIDEHSGEIAIVDTHHDDDKTDVLYKEREVYGEFNFRDSILEQLDSYFVYLDRMRKHDPDAWGFYKNVGATIVPYVGIGDLWRPDEQADLPYPKPDDWKANLTGWFLQTRPAFGCLAYGANPLAERRALEIEERTNCKARGKWLLIPRFMYFQKFENVPWRVQHPHGEGDVYKMTVWWDRLDSRYKHGRPEEYALVVRPDGRIEALRTLDVVTQDLKPKRSRAGGKRGAKRKDAVTISHQRWCLPNRLHDWAKQHHSTAGKWLARLFCDTVNHLETSSLSLVRVSVEKDGKYAMFSVDSDRMPYFFKDRDYQLTEKGHRKRIFHLVRPHTRKDGTIVKLQFRGQREFTWAGYNVKITVPGKDHVALEEVNIGVYDVDKKDTKTGWVTQPELGKRLRRIIDTGDINELTRKQG